MLTRLILGACLVFPLISSAETLAVVGKDGIGREEFEAAALAESQALKRALTREERVALLRSMANQRLLVAEARRRKLDREPALRAAVEEFSRRALAERIYNEEVAAKAAVSPEEARRFYDQNPALFDVAEVSQILVAVKADDPAAAEKKAQALAVRLKKAPRTFAAVAKKDSDDELSRPRGGDLGALRRGMLLPELEGAVFSAPPGGLVGPVRTQFGWHLLSVRSLKRLSWEQAGANLQNELRQLRAQQLQQALLEDAAKRVKVTLSEDKL